jgi:hypothetical protein
MKELDEYDQWEQYKNLLDARYRSYCTARDVMVRIAGHLERPYAPPDDGCKVTNCALTHGINPATILLGSYYFQRCLESDECMIKFADLMSVRTPLGTIGCQEPLSHWGTELWTPSRMIAQAYMACMTIAGKMLYQSVTPWRYFWGHMLNALFITPNLPMYDMEIACLRLLDFRLDVDLVSALISGCQEFSPDPKSDVELLTLSVNLIHRIRTKRKRLSDESEECDDASSRTCVNTCINV